MARVVQQRSSPPYLLIVFVMLFLIATVLAVLFYLNFDEQRKLAAGSEELREDLASDNELSRGRIAELLRRREQGELSETVVGHLTGRLDELVSFIHPAAADIDQAIARAEEAYETLGERGGLAPLAISLQERIAGQQETIESLRDELSQREEELEARSESLSEVEAEYERSLRSAKDEIAELQERISSLQQAQGGQIEGAQQRIEEVRSELQSQISEKVQTIDSMESKIAELEETVAGLRDQLERKTGRGVKALRPDGKILRVVEAENICYINLGAGAGLKPGITFSVYPDEGVPEMEAEEDELNGKGSIVVTKVDDTVSECRITEQTEGDPIVEGDLVANVVYDALRELEFVVIGQFDVFGTEQASESGAAQVRQMIRRIGGRITDDVTVQTDYVIVGQAPQRPATPPQSAPPSVWDVYEQRLEAYQQFEQIQSTAQGMRIPVLDEDRFLAFIGYTPEAQ
ncbi:MAG: BRCT domain-containing protein [Phycisphaerae bacterium]